MPESQINIEMRRIKKIIQDMQRDLQRTLINDGRKRNRKPAKRNS